MAVITEPVSRLCKCISMLATYISNSSTGVAAESDLLFKASLLVTVTKLVEVSSELKSLDIFLCYPLFQAVKEHSSSLGGLVVPLICESLSPGVTKFSFYPYPVIDD